MNIFEQLKNKETKLAVVGLGYVGLPLAVEFGKTIEVIGFDVKESRIEDLNNQYDETNETTAEDIKSAKFLEFTCDPSRLKEAKFIVVAVPTPINKNKQPDLIFMQKASETVGRNLSKGAIVVFESTVYPGVTEDICVPILEECSKLKCGEDFKIAYSPERINPGDKEHNVTSIIKVVSGMDDETLDQVAKVYEMVVKAGVFRAKSIKSAEAAKVIENTQRDLNIALINELAIIFNMMNIDTRAVLEAAGTKWNFIKMMPGLVGGHCIGVDPYYLTFKAEEIGYHPQVILAGRRINDAMGKYIAEQTVKKLIAAEKKVHGAKVMVMGITFKENVSDIRNSRVIDVVNELKDYGVSVSVADPLASKEEVMHEYGLELVDYSKDLKVDAIVLAVNHKKFVDELSVEVIKGHFDLGQGKGVLVDVKGVFELGEFDSKEVLYWRL
ncbi:MAG: nucleotide sugar dehydrogenase [Candidatus Omnitrophica bacterium]|nr:nucleotide sugar dehydrogenase [Candidatus Omnitrophota bacterium]MBU1995975.1 nucleotide sugar dehydrogenase [Candidatus Omnitrophota bacterium]MBU4334111.1 nucleotide sugar dehydrogenase [Candidatus Omnitrophota bacterium]